MYRIYTQLVLQVFISTGCTSTFPLQADPTERQVFSDNASRTSIVDTKKVKQSFKTEKPLNSKTAIDQYDTYITESIDIVGEELALNKASAVPETPHAITTTKQSLENVAPKISQNEFPKKQSLTNKNKVKGSSTQSWEVKDILSVLISIFAFILSILSFVWTWYSFSKTRKRSVIDDYWMRQVIFPNCMKPVIELVVDARAKYTQSNDLATFYDNFFLDKSNSVRDNFLLASPLSDEIQNKVNTLLDNLDDDIFEIRSEYEIIELMSKFANEVIELLKGFQDEL